jgi:hypothetical protein
MAALALIKGTVVRLVTFRKLKTPVDVFGFGQGGVVAAFERVVSGQQIVKALHTLNSGSHKLPSGADNCECPFLKESMDKMTRFLLGAPESNVFSVYVPSERQ